MDLLAFIMIGVEKNGKALIQSVHLELVEP
jgi:hypothetical protein